MDASQQQIPGGTQPLAQVTLPQAFWYWLKLGFISFGGPAAFGYHVLWSKGFSGTFDWQPALIALIAAIALFRFKHSVIQVIAACAVIGLILKISCEVKP